MAKIYAADWAGAPVRYRFLYPRTADLFGGYLKEEEGQEADVLPSEERVARAREANPPGVSGAYVEFRTMMGQTSRVLVPTGRCLFHAAALLWRGRAFLLTGRSGAGKTTQIRNWERLFPGEIRVISGDMPLLRAEADGRVTVHPTCWNGKEELCGAESAPLGGTVLLMQGDEDRMETPSVRDILVPLTVLFPVRPEDDAGIRGLQRLVTGLLSHPVRVFTNRGGDASTARLREELSALSEEKL